GRSTIRCSGASSKKFSRRVRPGALLVRARPWRRTIALMALDLPALERPTKATSAPRSGGNCPGAAALSRNRAWGNPLRLANGCCTAVVYNSPPSHYGAESGYENLDCAADIRSSPVPYRIDSDARFA